MGDESPHHASEKLIYILMFTLILSVMSATMFNIVLPQMSDEFELSISQVSWVMSAYALIYAIGTVVYGKLADSYKLKTLLTVGLTIFAMGSLVGLISQTFWMVIVGRCLQASGAAAVPALAMLIPVRYFTEERRGYALGMAAVGLALGSALGPIISALIVGFVHWRWLFCVPLLILFTLPFYRKYLEDEQVKPGIIDWLGGGLLGAAVALMLMGVTNGSWLFLGGGLILSGLFIVRIRYADVPFVQPRLFVNKHYTLILLIAFLVQGIGFSIPYLTPLLLADVYRLSPSMIGYALFPAAVASVILGRKGGQLADKKGNSYLFYVSSGLLLTCFIALSAWVEQSPILVSIFLIFGNVGQSFILIALTNSVSRTLPKEHTGVGMGLLSMLGFIAGGMAAGLYSRFVDIGIKIQSGFIYGKIYFVLVVMHVCIAVFYYYQFGRRKGRSYDHNVIYKSK